MYLSDKSIARCWKETKCKKDAKSKLTTVLGHIHVDDGNTWNPVCEVCGRAHVRERTWILFVTRGGEIPLLFLILNTKTKVIRFFSDHPYGDGIHTRRLSQCADDHLPCAYNWRLLSSFFMTMGWWLWYGWRMIHLWLITKEWCPLVHSSKLAITEYIFAKKKNKYKYCRTLSIGANGSVELRGEMPRICNGSGEVSISTFFKDVNTQYSLETVEQDGIGCLQSVVGYLWNEVEMTHSPFFFFPGFVKKGKIRLRGCG